MAKELSAEEFIELTLVFTYIDLVAILATTSTPSYLLSRSGRVKLADLNVILYAGLLASIFLMLVFAPIFLNNFSLDMYFSSIIYLAGRLYYQEIGRYLLVKNFNEQLIYSIKTESITLLIGSALLYCGAKTSTLLLIMGLSYLSMVTIDQKNKVYIQSVKKIKFSQYFINIKKSMHVMLLLSLMPIVERIIMIDVGKENPEMLANFLFFSKIGAFSLLVFSGFVQSSHVALIKKTLIMRDLWGIFKQNLVGIGASIILTLVACSAVINYLPFIFKSLTILPGTSTILWLTLLYLLSLSVLQSMVLYINKIQNFAINSLYVSLVIMSQLVAFLFSNSIESFILVMAIFSALISVIFVKLIFFKGINV